MPAGRPRGPCPRNARGRRRTAVLRRVSRATAPRFASAPPPPRQRCGLGERLVYLSPNVLLCSLRFLDVFVNSVFKHFIFQLFAVVR